MRINKIIIWCEKIDLQTNSLNQFFKEMYGDLPGEFVCGYCMGLKELKPLWNDHAPLNNGHFLLSPRWLLYRGWSTVSRILNHVQHCCTVVNRPLRAVDGSCTQNKPSTLLTVNIYFLALNQRWVSEEQGENETVIPWVTCSPLGPSLSFASAIFYKKIKQNPFI